MVLVILEDVKIYGSVALISISGIENLLHKIDLLDDVTRSARLDRWRSHVEHPHGLMVGESAPLHHFHRLKLLKTSLLCYLVLSLVSIMLEMSYICDVADIAHLVAKVTEEFHKHVVCHARSCVTEMSVAVNGRTADIKSDMTLIDRLEDLLLSRKRIGYI